MATMRSTPESSLPDINPDVSHLSVALENSEEEMKGKGTGDGGVFGSSESGVNFRTMTWWHASVVFLKGPLTKTTPFGVRKYLFH